jgi:hypothetical protein
MHGGEEPRDLAQRPQLEDGVVERGLAIEENAPELDHHSEA